MGLTAWLAGITTHGQCQSAIEPSVGGYYEFYTGHTLDNLTSFITGRNRIRVDGRLDHDVWMALASLRVTQAFWDPQAGGDFTEPKFRLWEAYADLYTADVDIRLGHQIIVWGKADGVFITDILSPLDLSEFLAQDFTDIRLAMPAVKVDYYSDDFTLTGVVVLKPQESILPTEESPWFVVPDLSSSPVPIEVGLGESNIPDFALENMEPAIRLSWTGLSQTEINIIYSYGFNRIPALGARVTGLSSEGVAAEVVPTYYRRYVFGLRWETAFVENWVIDSEMAYESRFDVAYDQFDEIGSPTPDDLLVPTEHLHGMLGAARQFGDTFARAQIVGSLIFPYAYQMVRDSFETSVTALVRHSMRRETLIANLFVFHNIGEDTWINPAIQWSPGGGFNLYAGIQAFFGQSEESGKLGDLRAVDAASAFGLYRDNDFVYVRITQHL